ncbi:MAG: hypothetical protein ACOY58_01800 [Candidatus Micrarchaeota archaeon]
MEQLAGCIDRGLAEVKTEQEEIGRHVEDIREIAATLNRSTGTSEDRETYFLFLREQLGQDEDPVRQHMARVMTSFAPGLFVGGDDLDLPGDNLDLERFFRQPKGHERRIHGRRHAGVRIVREGPTLILALNAHQNHPGVFERKDLAPYAEARVPACEREARYRGKVMRRARSKKRRAALLQELERRYLDSP